MQKVLSLNRSCLFILPEEIDPKTVATIYVKECFLPVFSSGRSLIYFEFIFAYGVKNVLGFSGNTNGKEPACQCKRNERCGFDPWVGKIPWRREWQPIPVFLPGESKGQRSLAG